MVEFKISTAVPQADLFARSQPAIQEGPPRPRQIAQTVIDFGNAIVAAGGELPENQRIRHAVLIALLRRALVTTESICDLLARGLEEPAVALTRTLLDIEVSAKLIALDKTDRMAKRLAAFHYYAYQRHGQNMLSNPETRLGSLTSSGRVEEVISVAKGYAELLESEVFNEIRDEVRSSQYWHGLQNVEQAFAAVDMTSDYFMLYDAGTWFVHDLNVDYDYIPRDDDKLTLKALVQRDPQVVRLHLGVAIMHFHQILQVYVEDRGLPDTPEFQQQSEVMHPDGRIERVDPMTGVTALLLSEFNVPLDSGQSDGAV